MGKRQKNRQKSVNNPKKPKKILPPTDVIVNKQVNQKFSQKWITVPRYQAILATCTLFIGVAAFYFNFIKPQPIQSISLPKIMYIATDDFLERIEKDNNIVIDSKIFSVYSDANNEIIDILKKTNTPNSYVGIIKVELWQENKLFVGFLRIPYESYANQLYVDSGYTTNKMILNKNEKLLKKSEFNIKIDESDADALLIPFCITRAMTPNDKLNNHETWNNCERIILRYYFYDGIYFNSKASDKEQHMEVTDMLSVKKILPKEDLTEPNEINNDIIEFFEEFIEN